MEGSHDRHGLITITLNSQDEKLLSPNGHWLPCNTCGKVLEVEIRVVSHECQGCLDHRCQCDDFDCQHVAHQIDLPYFS